MRKNRNAMTVSMLNCTYTATLGLVLRALYNAMDTNNDEMRIAMDKGFDDAAYRGSIEEMIHATARLASRYTASERDAFIAGLFLAIRAGFEALTTIRREIE